jgi:DNA adenine methylase
LFRVNNAGEFNAPFGNYKNPNIVNAATIRAVSSYFKENDVKIYNLDYKELLKNIPKSHLYT